jgi:acyl dehydratase
MTGRRYLDEFAPGDRFAAGSLTVSEADIRTFAEAFDPQAHHLDADAAQATPFRGLAASGWHTAALTMRLLVESGFRPAGGIVGRGVEITWLRPVRPGDRLTLDIEVLDAMPDRLRSEQGTLILRVQTLNGDGKPVQDMRARLLVPLRAGTAKSG